MGIQTSLTTFAKGCFLEGTMIGTPTGDKPIEELKAGDEVISYNEETKQQETSIIGEIDVLTREHYYVLNGLVSATGEHPFYTNQGVVEVQNLSNNHKLVGRYDKEIPLRTIARYEKEVTVYNLLDVVPNNNYYAQNLLVHNKGCFLAGTPIALGNGQYKNIEDIKPGDKVLSFNERIEDNEFSTVEYVDVLDTTSYYIINNKIKVTGEHPFYVEDEDLNLVIRKVEDLIIGDYLRNREGYSEQIKSIQYVTDDAKIYNLINVDPNHNYYAADILVHNKGGGCFLAGTKVRTPYGETKIEKLKVGDIVVSNNDHTKRDEDATIGKIDVLQAPGYYIINNSVKVTATHPMYVTNTDGNRWVKQVSDLLIGDNLVTDAGWQTIYKIEYKKKEVTVYNLIDVSPNHNYYANNYLVHNKGGGGGHSSGGGRSSSSHSSSSKSSSSKSIAPARPKLGTSTAKPGSKIKTADGKEIQTSAKKPTSSQYSTSKGVVGDNGYTPKFTNGYSAPAGSVVYYRDNNFSDYMFWAYLFNSNNSARPENQQATVVQPDGKEVITKPEPQGVDGLMVFNWIVFILVVTAILGGIIWLVNKLTSKEQPKKTGYYGNW